MHSDEEHLVPMQICAILSHTDKAHDQFLTRHCALSRAPMAHERRGPTSEVRTHLAISHEEPATTRHFQINYPKIGHCLMSDWKGKLGSERRCECLYMPYSGRWQWDIEDVDAAWKGALILSPGPRLRDNLKLEQHHRRLASSPDIAVGSNNS